eukprot:15468987-Alexandrium_andersonii.AAC.1
MDAACTPSNLTVHARARPEPREPARALALPSFRGHDLIQTPGSPLGCRVDLANIRAARPSCHRTATRLQAAEIALPKSI